MENWIDFLDGPTGVPGGYDTEAGGGANLVVLGEGSLAWDATRSIPGAATYRYMNDNGQTVVQGFDAYVSAVQQIQTSDMDANVKEAQIANLQQMFTTRQDFINTMYSESPKWADDWSQFDLSFGNS